MLKKVFDPNKMKNSDSSNIELRISNKPPSPNIFGNIQNRASKVSFDIENLICGNFLDAKEGF